MLNGTLYRFNFIWAVGFFVDVLAIADKVGELIGFGHKQVMVLGEFKYLPTRYDSEFGVVDHPALRKSNTYNTNSAPRRHRFDNATAVARSVDRV